MKISDLFDKMDEKVLKMKLNNAIDMLQKGDTEELARKINKMDTDELMEKLNDFDLDRIRKMNINREELKQKVSDDDLEKLKSLLGRQGEEVIKKLKEMME